MSRLLEIALGEYGVSEIAGGKHNERILEYSKEIGLDWVETDELAWCSIFMNWCCKMAGVDRSGKPNARSWLTVGEEVLDGPKQGDLAVFWRGKKMGGWGISLFTSEKMRILYMSLAEIKITRCVLSLTEKPEYSGTGEFNE